jgi:hypothetical protein
MGTSTTYLYGDSTPSPLETDFIAFLRDVFDFGVHVLQCDARVAEATRRVAALSERTNREIEAAEAFAAEVSQSLEGADLGDRDSIAARCAVRIRQNVQELVRSEAEAARAEVTASHERVAKTATTEREACFEALEALLLHHTLPESVVSTRLRNEGGTHYEALLSGLAPYGLEWTMSIAIPPTHALSSVLRVERIVPRLEVEAPEEAGWIHKEVKIRRQRLDRFYVPELAVDSAQTTVKLRTMPDGSGAGFDFLYLNDTGRMLLTRVRDYGVSPDAPHQVVGEDATKLRDFHDALVAMVKELASHKKALVKALFDDAPIQQVESPRLLVDRLIANIAPKVHEIAKRSLAPGELVLKRVVSDTRREELFVSTAELTEKLRSLPASARTAFDTLGLPSPRTSSRAPAPQETRPSDEELPFEASRRISSSRAPSPIADKEAPLAAKPVVVLPPGAGGPSQPPDAASASHASVRPSQPPHH